MRPADLLRHGGPALRLGETWPPSPAAPSGPPAAVGGCDERRRHWLRGAVSAPIGLGLGLGLAGCGFGLRRAPELQFKTIQLTGFRPRSPLAEELRTSLNASTTTRVVDALPQAQVVLVAITDAREKSIVASSAAGQVTEFQLRDRFSFRLRSADGRDLIPPTEIILSRDMSYTESAALGKEQEENFLYTAMQHDIVSQVLRRLASVPAP